MSSILTADEAPFRPGFWQRQFSSDSTRYQIVFDVMFGILMPLACLYFDPGIITGGFRLSVPMTPHAVVIYSISAIAISTLIFWLFCAPWMRLTAALAAGVFVSGAVCSITIGIIILPLTLLGLLVVIGVLGLVPFVTGFVYLRNAIRAIGAANAYVRTPLLAGAVTIALLVAAGLPAIAEIAISRIAAQSMTEILTERDPRAYDAAVQRLKNLNWTIDMDQLVRAYEVEPNVERKHRLARAYLAITGNEILDRFSGPIVD